MARIGDFLIGLSALLIGAWLTIWFIWRTIKKAEDPGRIAYKWVISFVFLVFLTMALVYIFPGLVLWLPDYLYGSR